MGMEEAGEGHLILTVERVHGENVHNAHVKSYRISRFGIHFQAGGQRHFIPHENISKVTVAEYDGGSW